MARIAIDGPLPVQGKLQEDIVAQSEKAEEVVVAKEAELVGEANSVQ
jgi:hypothetical protein